MMNFGEACGWSLSSSVPPLPPPTISVCVWGGGGGWVGRGQHNYVIMILYIP